jgi:hypothetical protein
MWQWTEEDLKNDFDRAKATGWLQHFNEAAAAFGFSIVTLLALASRETNIQNKLGDGGHGHGVLQVDDRSYPQWCATSAWKDPRMSILKGTEILAGKLLWLKQHQDKPLHFRGHDYVGKVFASADEGLRVAIAGYNCGEGVAYYCFSEKGNPDAGTAHGNYSADVLARAAVFAKLLGS